MDIGIESEELLSASTAASTQRGQGRSRAGINVTMRYIQSSDGTVIDGHRAKEMRNHARAVFVGLADDRKFFASWGDADAMSRRIYYNEMAVRFEELSYCELDWKAEQIAIDVFSGWKTSWTKKQKRTRQESVTKISDQKRFKGPESIDAGLTSLPPIPSDVCSLFFVSS